MRGTSSRRKTPKSLPGIETFEAQSSEERGAAWGRKTPKSFPGIETEIDDFVTDNYGTRKNS